MTLFENAYNEVAAIVREFEEHHGEFMAHKYQESEVRTDFIDKFFTALGWDVAHREQTNPREREVKIEKSDTAGSTRRVDYAFYLKPDYRNPVFFCEAKKPSRDLNNADDYFQLVRYGYGASTPVGALTNFDEFHIIDCRYQPHIEKSYPSAQIKVYSYKDYLDKEAFGYIYWLFSREAVEAGKLKDFAKSLPKQQGKGKAKLTAEEAKPVDEAFLTKLEEYRLILAKAFKKADETLNAEVLTEATQKVIDRLVFIRFLEDKYIETDYIVDQIAAVRAGTGVRGPGSGSGTNSPTVPGSRNPVPVRSAWKSFLSWSKELDVKYNGVVFKPHDIDKTEWKAPDDKVFADLCADISHVHTKYSFTYIPIELLGSIYERFLGKVVTTTAKRAEIEDKPEVRKAGGVYYTPKYIVDYIVSNTVGKLLDGVREPGAGNREESILTTNKLNGKNTDKKLSRSPSVADGDGYDGRGIRPSGITPEGRTVRTTQSDESRGDLRSKQYSRGMGPDNEDLHLSSDGSVRITDGDRDTSIDSNAQEIPHSGTNSKILGVQLSDGSNAQPIDAVVGAGSGFRAPGTGVAPSFRSSPPSRTPEPGSRFPLTPKEISKLRFADIACGSGSFLIAVYDTVLHHVEKWYNDHPDEAKKAKCTEIEKGIYVLSLKQKQQILLDNIFGVDIDRQAVEVAQLSLFLKLLESESGATAEQLSFERTKILPDLSRNIQCGNSLVEYDISDLFPLTDEEEKGINPFSFHQAFKPIMDAGGFDAIVGNPPYVRQELITGLKGYLKKHYSVYHNSGDLYTYFIERAVSLLNQRGQMSYIVANKWMRANYGLPLREWLMGQSIVSILDFGVLQVFKGATTYPCIISIERSGQSNVFDVSNIETLAFDSLFKYAAERSFSVEKASLQLSGWTLSKKESFSLIEKLKTENIPLGKYVDGRIYRGILTGLNEAFVINGNLRDELISVDPKSAALIKPFLAGRDIRRYDNPGADRYIILIPNGWTKQNKGKGDAWTWLKAEYPAVSTHLSQFAKAAEARWDKGEYWWELRPCDYYTAFESPRIILPAIVQRASYAYSESVIYSNDKTSVIGVADKFLLGILNSKVSDYYLHSIASTRAGGFYEYKPMYVAQIPIPKTQPTQQTGIVKLVDQMLATKKQLAATQRDTEREQLQRKCDYLDGEIDRLVYELYGLTAEEIKIVEGN